MNIGDPEQFKLLSDIDGEVTTAMEIPDLGCVVKVFGGGVDNDTSAICFVPGCKIVPDKNGGNKLTLIQPLQRPMERA